MVVVVKKLDPLKPVEQQVNDTIKGKLRPVLFHQHPRRITPLIPGLTTDQLPKVGNYAKATVKL